jgi:high-affinity Fe2+/Pb2+ permease
MDIDEEMRRQTAVSIAAVGLFLASLIGIGIVYNGAGGLPSNGALAIIGALTGFVLLMAVIGMVLSRIKDDDESTD